MKKHLSKRLLSLFLAVLMVATSAPLVAYATVESGDGKQTGTSEGQPFTAEPSDTYRIPNLVTLDDGTLVAMAAQTPLILQKDIFRREPILTIL